MGHQGKDPIGQRIIRTIVQALIVLLVGGAFGLVANAVNSDGIALLKNHFATAESSDAGTAPDLSDENYRLVEHEAVIDLHQGPGFEVGVTIFIDARDDKHYAEGHIPGAYQLDHYRVDKYIDDLLPACRDASKIVVYCNGGKCEDSKLAVNDLIQHGVAEDKLHVYIGGVVAWKEDGLPFEPGERNSGEIVYLDPE